MYLLDTCVVSEMSRPKPSALVDAWFEAQDQDDLFLSAVSVGEMRFGFAMRDHGRKRMGLERWFAEAVLVGFAGRVLPFDMPTAVMWGDLRAAFPNAKAIDAQIAATALVRGLTVVTRNEKDFAFDGLAVFNPWKR